MSSSFFYDHVFVEFHVCGYSRPRRSLPSSVPLQRLRRCPRSVDDHPGSDCVAAPGLRDNALSGVLKNATTAKTAKLELSAGAIQCCACMNQWKIRCHPTVFKKDQQDSLDCARTDGASQWGCLKKPVVKLRFHAECIYFSAAGDGEFRK